MDYGRKRKFSRGQSAPVDREGGAELKTKKRKKASKPPVKSKAPAMPPTGGMAVGLPI